MHFLALPGSLRRGSYTRAIAGTLDELAPDDVSVDVVTSFGDLPLYNQDLEDAGLPRSVIELTEQVLSADALVIVTPEYNHSIPGILKNAIDWLSRSALRPLDGKPVALQSASPGLLGGARAQEHLRLVMAAVGSTVLVKPEVIVGQVAGKVDSASNLLREPETREKVAVQLQALTELARTVAANAAASAGEA